jgi:ribosomal protein S18 acetylase RimI-like enzyme
MVRVRRLGPGDESVLTLIAEQAPEFDLAGRTSPERPRSPGDAAAYLAEPSVLHWVAEEDGRVLGELLCHLLKLPSGEGRELLLYSIGVRASDRRRGVGRARVRDARLDESRGGPRRCGCSLTIPARRRSTPPAASSAARSTSRAS